MAKGSTILASDYNSIREKIINVLGSGVGQLGYGQDHAISSSPVVGDSITGGNEITAAQWNELLRDLQNIRLHQEGALIAIDEVATGQLIEFGSGHPNNRFNTVIDQLIGSRFNIAPSRSLVSPINAPGGATRTFTTAWSQLAETTLKVTFDNSDDARYFFNSGGKIRFTSTRTGGSSTAQNVAWTNLLNSVGVFQFGANTPFVLNFYSLTSVYQAALNVAPGGIYQANTYRIEAKCDVPNNSTGTAKEIEFRISWIDDYIDNFPSAPPPDRVDGTLTLSVEELKATGPLFPETLGNFTIASPECVLNDITAA